MRSGELLSVGEAAIVLRASREQVVDLCARGLLPYVTDGAHRRVRRADVEALARPALSPEQLEQLWLHRAIAGKFVANPMALLAGQRGPDESLDVGAAQAPVAAIGDVRQQPARAEIDDLLA